MSIFDVPVALMVFVGGLVMLGLRKQQENARVALVKKGEMTEAEAKKKNREWSLSSYTLIVLGVGIAVSHYLS